MDGLSSSKNIVFAKELDNHEFEQLFRFVVMKLIFFNIILFFSVQAFAQVMPLGLYEGLMGNTGVATTHSTAASYYNPSLLRQRSDHAFSINGNTVGSSSTKSAGSSFSSSLGLSPSFLSDLIVGDKLVHEFFLATSLQGQFNWRQSLPNSSYDADLSINRVVTGYSMAFRSLPFALQVLGRYSEAKSFGVAESSDPANNIYSVSKVKTDFKNLSVALGVSSHFVYNYYTFGVNLTTRGLSLYNRSEGTTKTFTHGPLPTDYLVTESDSGRTSVSNVESKMSIGHGFKVGNHEFLTDSVFVEYSGNLNSYDFTQSFGYRYGLADGHQVLCGVGHNFGSDVSYFGQSLNTSVGYSWKTRQLRSAIGLYYSRSNASEEASSSGVIFGGEYEY